MKLRRSHRGFTMTEILASLILLVIFFEAAGLLFRSNVLTGAACVQIGNESARTDSALFQLRQDVWNAREVNSPQPGTIELKDSGDSKIIWRFDSDGATRTAGGTPEHWAGACRDCSVAIDKRWVGISDKTGDVRLTGPILLSEP